MNERGMCGTYNDPLHNRVSFLSSEQRRKVVRKTTGTASVTMTECGIVDMAIVGLQPANGSYKCRRVHHTRLENEHNEMIWYRNPNDRLAWYGSELVPAAPDGGAVA